MDIGTGVAIASVVIPASIAINRILPKSTSGDKFIQALCDQKHEALEREIEKRDAVTHEQLTEIKQWLKDLNAKMDELIKCSTRR